jgi:hypothetical protein
MKRGREGHSWTTWGGIGFHQRMKAERPLQGRTDAAYLGIEEVSKIN